MPQPTAVERRRDQRIASRLPITMEWQGSDDDLHRVRGTTRDISRGGVYCFLEHSLPVGLPVEFDVVFVGELTAGAPLKLRCRGRILRQETYGRRFGVAALIENYQVLESLEPTWEADRRTHVRVLPHTGVTVEYPGVRSVVRDVSMTGAFVEDERPFPVGRSLELILRGETLNDMVRVKAVVRRVEPQIGMAVEFVSLSRDAQTQLRQIVQTGSAELV